MDSEEVYFRIVSTAERFGADNTQELKLLSLQLAKCEAAEVRAGLLLVFSRSDPLESNYQKQELAGRMLEKINPNSSLDLDEALPSLLQAYDLSIENCRGIWQIGMGRKQWCKHYSGSNPRRLILDQMQRQEQCGGGWATATRSSPSFLRRKCPRSEDLNARERG